MKTLARFSLLWCFAAMAPASVNAAGATATYRTANTQWVSNYVHTVVTNTNPYFSNQVVNVGIGIDTNSVAVLNEIAANFGGFPLTSGETATTVGGLLAALAAAVAWLKKHLSYTSGESAADRVCSKYTISDATPITVPKPYTDGKVADFVIYLDMSGISSGDAPTISYQFSDGSTPSIVVPDGEALAYTIGSINCVYFTQIGDTAQYAVAVRAFKAVTQSS